MRRLALLLAVCLCLQLQAQDSVYFRASEWRQQLEGYYKADSVQFPAPHAVLFVGSSSIRMWKDLPSYFPGHYVLGRGFGGAWMSDVLYHMDRLVIGYRPSQVVLYAGENDLANGVSPEQVAGDAACFLRLMELHLPGVPVLVVSVKPSPSSARFLDAQRRTNELLEELCRTKAHVRFIDIATPMLTPDGGFRENLYLSDRLHITPEAYRLWASILGPHLISQ